MPSHPPVRLRALDLENDLDAVHRIWLDCGWIESSDEHKQGLKHFLTDGSGWVSEVRGTPEALAYGTPGTLRHTGGDLPAQLISAVTVSRLARGRGLAGAATARLVADAADAGAVVSVLGMFDEGYYDKLGFGTGTYFRFMTVDPGLLDVPAPARIPIRLTKDDAERMWVNRLGRLRKHGAFSVLGRGAVEAEWAWTGGGFGVGFEDDSGRLTHHIFVKAKGEEGPYHLKWFAYETHDQLVELLGVVASWRAQVLGVRMYDPPGLQLQDFVRSPLRQQWARRKSDFAVRPESFAWWQARVLDVPRFTAAIRAVEDVRFVVELSDPIGPRLARSKASTSPTWAGVGGSWVVSLGAQSHAEAGEGPGLPRLRASVGAWTRLLLGVGTAVGLSVTDDLSGSVELLAALDRALRLPSPNIDWDL